jgi:hypothetical protein
MSDDEIIDAEDLDPAMLIEVDPDAEVLDADAIGIEGDEEAFGLSDADDLADDLAVIDESEDPDAIPVAADTAAKKAGDDEDDDDDLRTEDDVEADLDSILKEKLTAADDTPLEDEEDGVVVDDKTDGMERLQPRRPDETQCTQCFLLVRNSAPGCPVEDDACPLFK